MEHRKPEEPGRPLSIEEFLVPAGGNSDPALDAPTDAPPATTESPVWRSSVDWSGE